MINSISQTFWNVLDNSSLQTNNMHLLKELEQTSSDLSCAQEKSSSKP